MDVPAVDDVALVKSIADDLPVAIWLGTVPEGKVVYVNRAFEDVLGMGPPEEAARGNYVAPYSVHTRDGAPYPEGAMPYEVVLRTRAIVVIDDLVIHRGARKIPLRVFAKPLFDGRGEITHVLEAFHDISREVEADRARADGEVRLRQAQRMEAIGNLAGGVAHDFNNMLAAIKILASHLERSERDAERLRLLGDIGHVVDTAAELTRALLRFARRSETAVEPISASAIASQVADLARRTIGRNIEITTDFAEDTVVLGDGPQIEQVLMNLVVNARDAMPEGGRLSLSVRAVGREVEIVVTDNGSGIEESLRERVFEPYFTTKTTGPVKGTGLGLATAYAVVQAHGGTIAVEAAPGGGTVMRVLLPRAEGAAVPAPPKARPRATAKRGTLLFVDDEREICKAATVALEAIGYRVLHAERGDEAVRVFREAHQEIDAVVLDMMMPGMGGRATYLALREIAAHVPVVITSGLSGEGEASRTLEMGARAFVAKPYDLDALCEIIERARSGQTGVTSV